ncbi:MAG: 30S ribosomal protein S6 [Candidatus Omnitrophica bacterium]|nr:30S ribosomal protein S6 [Candidatus Omnitrophota bacterium]
MNQYEGIFIMSPVLDEEKLKGLTAKIEETLVKQGGKVTNVTNWGRRNLPYRVKKAREGYFVVLDFTLPPDKVKTLQAAYRLLEDLLRITITVKSSSKPAEPSDKPRVDAKS